VTENPTAFAMRPAAHLRLGDSFRIIPDALGKVWVVRGVERVPRRWWDWPWRPRLIRAVLAFRVIPGHLDDKGNPLEMWINLTPGERVYVEV